eukprot:jgi/Psemu1/3713/gm1.3713_g
MGWAESYKHHNRPIDTNADADDADASADAADADAIARLVKQLAIYEREPDGVSVGAEETPVLLPVGRCDNHRRTTTAAMGLFYFGYKLEENNNKTNISNNSSNGNDSSSNSSNSSRGGSGGKRFLYLEDLYCEPMKQLAPIALAPDCQDWI